MKRVIGLNTENNISRTLKAQYYKTGVVNTDV